MNHAAHWERASTGPIFSPSISNKFWPLIHGLSLGVPYTSKPFLVCCVTYYEGVGNVIAKAFCFNYQFVYERTNCS